jgi:hypothetical protein
LSTTCPTPRVALRLAGVAGDVQIGVVGTSAESSELSDERLPTPSYVAPKGPSRTESPRPPSSVPLKPPAPLSTVALVEVVFPPAPALLACPTVPPLPPPEPATPVSAPANPPTAPDPPASLSPDWPPLCAAPPVALTPA